jgi:hypothetical protein
MLPRKHILFGIFTVVILYLLFPKITFFNLVILFFSSFLIDVDHYFYYILKKKDLNLTHCYNWYKQNVKRTLSLPMNERKKIYSGFYIFHGIEWIIILFLLGTYFYSPLLYVSLGFLLHFVIDAPHEFYIKRTLDKSSLIYNVYRFRKLQKKV